MKKVLKVAFALLTVLLLVLFYGVRTSVPVPATSRFTIDLAALRTAAGPDDALPAIARAEEVARADLPNPGVIEGGAFKNVTFAFYCWQFVYGDGSSAVVDTVHDRKKHESDYAGFPYRDAGWEHQERALLAAKAIAVTHEHHDHIGGIAASAHGAKLAPALKLTAAQRRLPPFGGTGLPIGGEPTLESGPEGSLHVVAPGIVAITAAGHTPGSQLIYVRLKDHRELLLIGDVAWSQANLSLARTRPRLTSWVMSEDAEAVVNQLAAIIALHRAAPAVDVVVSHDAAAMEARFKSGAVLLGLQ